MEFVMVPVPEDHVVDVMRHIAGLVARASVEPWTSETVGQHFDEVDEACRSLLSVVARAIVTEKDISEDDAAKALELDLRYIREITREINEGAQREKREPLVSIRDAEVVLRNGRTAQKRLFAMSEPVARMIRAHELASVAAEQPAPSSSPE